MKADDPYMANGVAALVGAGEFLSVSDRIDIELLKYITGTARVAIVPAASAPDGGDSPQRWAKMGVDHFTRLGATAFPVMALTRADMQNESFIQQIRSANFVYFSGGKPRYLLETLTETPFWAAVKDIFAAGGVIAGCSAGAMVMAEYMADFPQVWKTLPALGIAKNLTVIPHFDELPQAIKGPIGAMRHKGYIAGIDGSTALIGPFEQNTWNIVGRGAVTIYSASGKKQYPSGSVIQLDGKEYKE